MPTYNVPGVWVEEVASFPPSVVQVATAIPAFIGYTEKGRSVARIKSLLDYENQFGKAKPATFQVTVATDGRIDLQRTDAETNKFLMYYAMSMYFRNGGGACYVVPVGDYTSAPAKGDFVRGLAELEMLDEPTLIVLVDTPVLSHAENYDLAQQTLTQCEMLGDRFAIFDVPRDEEKTIDQDVADFRNGIGTQALSYGAAYFPHLISSQNYQYTEEGVQVPGGVLQGDSGTNGLQVSNTISAMAVTRIVVNTDAAVTTVDFAISSDGRELSIVIPANGDTTAKNAADGWKTWSKDRKGFDIAQKGDGSSRLTAGNIAMKGELQTLSTIRTSNTALYNKVKVALANDPASRVVLPPSSAMAGVYARVDGERGVWKAPANVSIASVIGPVSRVSNEDQSRLNVDANSGKSINAIRDFTGKGTLVWGARTLLGNDNEWRYVSVRRLFIMIEESTRKASSFAVFEPNDATTWLKVKAMVDSYLYGLWEQGALAGSKPEQAYFVNVGLGRTMTATDILEGRMIIEIGVAAVRPAEFIILRFSHKMQEA